MIIGCYTLFAFSESAFNTLRIFLFLQKKIRINQFQFESPFSLRNWLTKYPL